MRLAPHPRIHCPRLLRFTSDLIGIQAEARLAQVGEQLRAAQGQAAAASIQAELAQVRIRVPDSLVHNRSISRNARPTLYGQARTKALALEEELRAARELIEESGLYDVRSAAVRSLIHQTYYAPFPPYLLAFLSIHNNRRPSSAASSRSTRSSKLR